MIYGRLRPGIRRVSKSYEHRFEVQVCIRDACPDHDALLKRAGLLDPGDMPLGHICRAPAHSHSPVTKNSRCTDHVTHGVETDARSLFQGLRSATSPNAYDAQGVLAGRRSPEDRIRAWRVQTRRCGHDKLRGWEAEVLPPLRYGYGDAGTGQPCMCPGYGRSRLSAAAGRRARRMATPCDRAHDRYNDRSPKKLSRPHGSPQRTS